MSNESRLGEGDRKFDQNYRQRTKELIESGEVDEKAKQARPADEKAAER